MIQRLASAFNTVSPLTRRLAGLFALLIAGIVFWLMREKAFLLGDGNLVVRILRTVMQRADIPPVFSTEPLAGFIFWKVRQLLDITGVPYADEFPIQIVNLVCGIFSIALIWRIGKQLSSDGGDRLLLFILMIGSGVSLFFFGYVEDYPPLYCCYLLFLSYLIRSDRMPVFILSALYGVLFVFHFAMGCLLPVMIIVWYTGWKQRSLVHGLTAPLLSLGTAALLLWLSGFTTNGFWENISARGRHILKISPGDGYWAGYGFFSPFHFVDLVNMILLIWPAALVVIYIVASSGAGRSTLREKPAILLTVTALCGLFFATAVNPELGMSRDWDLIATYLSALPIFGAVALSQLLNKGLLPRRLLVLAAGLSLVPTIAWVSVNADGESAAQRCSTLLDFRVMGRHAYFTGLEELAVYYRWNKDVAQSAEYYEKLLALDPYRTRIWESLAHLYELNGDERQEAHVFERAIQQGAVNEEIVVSLAGIYVRRGELPEAGGVMKKGTEALPNSAGMNRSYGVFLLTSMQNYRGALEYLSRSLSLDSTSADAWYNAGLCCYRLHDTPGMTYHFINFLRLEPFGTDADRVRQLLAGTAKNNK